jgi:hypothetical protein
MGEEAGIHDRRRHCSIGSNETHHAQAVLGGEQPAYPVEVAIVGHEH